MKRINTGYSKLALMAASLYVLSVLLIVFFINQEAYSINQKSVLLLDREAKTSEIYNGDLLDGYDINNMIYGLDVKQVGEHMWRITCYDTCNSQDVCVHKLKDLQVEICKTHEIYNFKKMAVANIEIFSNKKAFIILIAFAIILETIIFAYSIKKVKEARI